MTILLYGIMILIVFVALCIFMRGASILNKAADAFENVLDKFEATSGKPFDIHETDQQPPEA